MTNPEEDAKFFARLKEMDEKDIRLGLTKTKNTFGAKASLAQGFLDELARARAEDLDKETLEIARSANTLASSANSLASKALCSNVRSETAAWIAAIAAIIAAIAATSDSISDYLNNKPEQPEVKIEQTIKAQPKLEEKTKAITKY